MRWRSDVRRASDHPQKALVDVGSESSYSGLRDSSMLGASLPIAWRLLLAMPLPFPFSFPLFALLGSFARRTDAGSLVSHNRNPPRKALRLSPARHLVGSVFSSLALPPPSTTSSGSRAASRRRPHLRRYCAISFSLSRAAPGFQT